MKPTTVIQLERFSGADFKQRGKAAYGHLGLQMGCKGSTFWYHTRLMMRCSGEEPKAEKGRALVGLGGNKHEKTGG